MAEQRIWLKGNWMEQKKLVYVITNKVNGKRYVGSTERPAAYRFQEHISNLRGHRHHSEDLQKDYDKYGEAVFSFEVVDEVTKSGKESEEYEWMRRLHTYDPLFGYNNDDPAMSKARKDAEQLDADAKMMAEICREIKANKELRTLVEAAIKCDSAVVHVVAEFMSMNPQRKDS